VSASPVARGAAGDRGRLFVTALLVYAVCLNPAMFRARQETLSLVLIDRPDAAPAYDHQMLTPVERVISDQ